MDRRTFLELIGATGASSLISCKGAPLQRMYAYLTPPEEIVPGVAVYYASVCRACPAGCGLVVKTREARPIKLEGNPAHPVNQGALCSRGQAFIQGLYGRSRVKEPLIREKGELKPASWDKALNLVAERLRSAHSPGLLTGLESGSMEDLFADFLRMFPQATHRVWEPMALRPLGKAAELLFGMDEIPQIDLSNTDYVLSLGADLLDTWVSPVKFAAQWSNRHGYAEGRKLHLEYWGPRRNLTATAADEFHCISANSCGLIAAALLKDVYSAKKGSMPVEKQQLVERMIQKLGPSSRGEFPLEKERLKK